MKKKGDEALESEKGKMLLELSNDYITENQFERRLYQLKVRLV